MDKSARTHRFELRLTEDEFNSYEQFAKNYSSRSAFVRTAVLQYNDKMARKRYELMEMLYKLLREYQSNFAHMGANLNQCMHRINELKVMDSLNCELLEQNIAPQIKSLNSIIGTLNDEMAEIYKKATDL